MNQEPQIDDGNVDYDSISMLIPSCRDGDSEARAELLQHLQGYLSLMAARHLDPSLQNKVGPSDIVQNTMLLVVEKFDQFRGNTTAEFRAWLKQITRNEISRTRRQYRAEKRNISREQRLGPIDSEDRTTPRAIDANLTPSSEAMAAEEIARFHEVLGQLPDDYAQVIRLRSIDQLAFQEIAERMGRSHDSVTKLWYRAIVKFESLMRDQHETE